MLNNAVQGMFRFMRYQGMEPTNNESERALREVVICHKMRQKMVISEGKGVRHNNDVPAHVRQVGTELV